MELDELASHIQRSKLEIEPPQEGWDNIATLETRRGQTVLDTWPTPRTCLKRSERPWNAHLNGAPSGRS